MTNKTINLSSMQTGENGVVSGIQGGIGLLKRLENLGIRPGVKITKISAQFMRGPVTVQVGNTRIALGFGMAQKIMVEIEPK